MSSQAEIVFSIPELLEQILLYLDESPRAPDIQLSKILYTLQRVSRSFDATIRGSRRLQWRLGNTFPLEKDMQLLSGQNLISEYLLRRELKTGSFEYGEVTFSATRRVSSIRFSTYADGQGGSACDSNALIGILGRSRRLHASAAHPWRRIYINIAPVVLIVEVTVQFTDPSAIDRKTHASGRYSEWLFEMEESDHIITLGHLADMLNTINQRTLFQHKALSACYQLGEETGKSPSWNHSAAERFLQRSSMCIAWMRFEPQAALARLKKTTHDGQLYAPTKFELLDKIEQARRRRDFFQARLEDIGEELEGDDWETEDDSTDDLDTPVTTVSDACTAKDFVGLRSPQPFAEQLVDHIMMTCIGALVIWSAYVVVSFLFSH